MHHVCNAGQWHDRQTRVRRTVVERLTVSISCVEGLSVAELTDNDLPRTYDVLQKFIYADHYTRLFNVV